MPTTFDHTNSIKDVALQGSAELLDKLASLGGLDNLKAVAQMVRSGMLPTLQKARTTIPVGTRLHRTYKGRLVAPGFGKRSLKIVVTNKTDSGRMSALLGVKGEAFYEVQFMERGWSKHAAVPWLRPAFYSTKAEQERAMVAYMQKWIAKKAKSTAEAA